MRNAAVVMLVVYIFDFCAWLLFFNSVFHSQDDVLKRDELTILAGVFALLLSTATIIYERDFFCHDPDETRWRRGWALAIRLTVIAVTALATASTVDILLFRGPIRERIHQESVLSTLTAQWHKIEEQRTIAGDAQKEFDAADEQAKKQREAQQVLDTKREADAIELQRKGAAGQLQAAMNRTQQLAARIARQQNQLNETNPRDTKKVQELTQSVAYDKAVLDSTNQMIPILQTSNFQLSQQAASAIQLRDNAYTDLLKKRDALQKAAIDKKNAAERAER